MESSSTSNKSTATTTAAEAAAAAQVETASTESIYETIAQYFFDETAYDNQIRPAADLQQTRAYTNTVSMLRVGLPSLVLAATAKLAYAPIAMQLANNPAIFDSGVFAVVAQDASQYIQNILTTSGLMFSILVGQTYYFMYQVRTVRVVWK